MEVLTVASTVGSFELTNHADFLCRTTTGRVSGAAGHVLLTYPSGGTLLTSCGHWMELSNLDVSAKTLFSVAQEEYGAEVAYRMESDFISSAGNEAEQSRKLQTYAKTMVHQSAPCKSKKSSK